MGKRYDLILQNWIDLNSIVAFLNWRITTILDFGKVLGCWYGSGKCIIRLVAFIIFFSSKCCDEFTVSFVWNLWFQTINYHWQKIFHNVDGVLMLHINFSFFIRFSGRVCRNGGLDFEKGKASLLDWEQWCLIQAYDR